MSTTNKILNYAKSNMESFECGGVSSNEIRFFEYGGKKYVLKTPLVVGDNLSPFWRMMKNLFHFSFEKQNAILESVYNVLKSNPHIPIAPFVVADEEMMIFEFVEGQSWSEDEFPKGKDNAYRLGQYVGYNHQISHKNCGVFGSEDVEKFFSQVFEHMKICIDNYWNGEEEIEKRVRAFYQILKGHHFESSKYSLMMVDICADQFLYNGEDIVACVDLDSYVIGPVEWELSFLKNQIEDWASFKAGYETYQKIPEFDKISDLFYLLMGLNSYGNKYEMEMYWSKFLMLPF